MPPKIKSEAINDRYLSDREVAARWSCSPTLVRRLRYRGHLPAIKIGGVSRVALSAVIAYEAAQTEGGAA